MRPSDIARIAVVEELDVAIDGTTAVVARRVIRRGSYVTHLFAIDLTGRPGSSHGRRRPRRLTDGNVIDGWPRISPDGMKMAFIRSASDHESTSATEPNFLCVVSIDGGRVRTITPRGPRPGFGAVSELAWAPDGATLAFTAEVDPPRTIVGDRPPIGSKGSRRADADTPVARRITRADWRADGDGHLDYWAHLHIVGASGLPQPRQITHGNFGVSDIAWHPNGSTVAFAADRSSEPDVRPLPAVWAVDIDAGPRSKRSTPRVLMQTLGGASKPSFSPNGEWVCGVGVMHADPLDDVSPGLIVGPANASSAPWAASPALDRPIGNWCETDLNGWMVDDRTTPVWLDDHTVVAPVTDRGRSLPMRWHLDTEAGRVTETPTVSDRSESGPWADMTTHALAVARNGADPATRVMVLGTLDGRAMELMSVDLDRQEVRTHTSFGSSWQRKFVQPEMQRLDCPGPGGAIETWIASPVDTHGVALPAVIDIHGGPLGAWAAAPSLEVMLLVSAGYRVVLPNIRGSAGYGGDWIRPQLGDWGGVDAADVHAVLDHVIDLGMVDPARVGLLGLSYGGFMVNWLVGTSDRFTAAVSENGVTNQVSAWANSDGGPSYCRSALLGDPFTSEGIDALWRQSPLRHVAEVTTPLLLLQGEADLVCPPQDNEQFFIALRQLGRPVEYVLYPEESHVYASAGRPDRRIDRAERVLDWFARHLS